MSNRLWCLTFISVSLFGCATKTAPTEPFIPEPQLASALENNSTDAGTLEITPEDPNSIYIGYVEYIQETNELQTEISVLNPLMDYEALAKLSDSTLFSSDLLNRRRIPLETARRNFRLSGLDEINIFNDRHQLVGKLGLKGVVHSEDAIEGAFVAVYDARGLNINAEQKYYSVSASRPVRSGFQTIGEKNEQLERIILETLKHDTTSLWAFQHKRNLHDNVVYSIATSSNASFITEYSAGKLAIVKDVYDDQFYMDILPLPIYENGKPLILVSEGVRESDYMWDFLLRYNGNEYEGVSYNRIK